MIKMNKLLALALAGTCSAASAQTPAINPMPDGSRDMYLGLGAQSAPRYEGAGSRKVNALPVIQVQWSNGLFIAGSTAGLHLSSQPSYEFGPLLALQPRRDAEGTGPTSGGIGVSILPPFGAEKNMNGPHALDGMDKIATRLLGGAFFNYYLAPQLRLTSSVLWGAGNERDGGKAEFGVQRLANSAESEHRVSLSAGFTVANRAYNQAYFGVTAPEAIKSGYRWYSPKGGIKDVHVGVRWNWALSPSWLLTSQVQATRLMGSAKDSPLVERPTNLTVSTAIAYRF
jgi:outer membrane scaffolding protein for murein synthesis (MipA/OmpV family)